MKLASLKRKRRRKFAQWASCPTSQSTREFALSLEIEEIDREIAARS